MWLFTLVQSGGYPPPTYYHSFQVPREYLCYQVQVFSLPFMTVLSYPALFSVVSGTDILDLIYNWSTWKVNLVFLQIYIFLARPTSMLKWIGNKEQRPTGFVMTFIKTLSSQTITTVIHLYLLCSISIDVSLQSFIKLVCCYGNVK